jgi:hypothetical protein
MLTTRSHIHTTSRSHCVLLHWTSACHMVVDFWCVPVMTVSSHNQGCHADVVGRTDGRSDDGRGGVRDLNAL